MSLDSGGQPRTLAEIAVFYPCRSEVEMPEGWQWDETLFSGSAPYYLRGRLPYAPGLAERLAEVLDLDGRGRLLDVGCGPGVLTLSLAPFVVEAVGVAEAVGAKRRWKVSALALVYRLHEIGLLTDWRRRRSSSGCWARSCCSLFSPQPPAGGSTRSSASC